jgi:hypothetical protein
MRRRSDQRAPCADERSVRGAHDVPVVEHRSVVGATRSREIPVGEGGSEELGTLAQLVGDGARAEKELAVRCPGVDEDAALALFTVPRRQPSGSSVKSKAVGLPGLSSAICPSVTWKA